MKTLQEYLIDVLRSTRLYEMTKAQTDCEDRVRSQVDNILQNLTLINYFRISELYTTNINHWKGELRASILNAHNFRMRKDKSEGRRERIVNRVFDEEDVYVHEEVYNRVLNKLYTETETQYDRNDRSDEWLDEAIIRTISQMSMVTHIIISSRNTVPALNSFINGL